MLNFFYIQIRGVENLAINLEGIDLPLSTRLNLYKNENIFMKPLQFLTLVEAQPGKGGAVYSILL